MDSSLLFSFVVVVLVGSASVSHANLPAQIYWHTKLPNTPMPAAIRELLRPDLEDEKPTSVAVGKGVDVDTGYGKPGGTYVDVGKGGVHVDAGKDKPSGTTVGVGKGGVHVYTGHKGKPVVVHVGYRPFLYRYAATADQLHDDPAVALFFLEKDLRPGSEMKLQFYETQPGSTFRTRLVADSIPFSSAKTAAIFKRLSIDPNSPEAEAMKKTLETCESPAANGEEKLCATSLESMVDFATAKLGSHVKALATEADKDSPRQVYTVEAAAQKMAGAKSVSCHSESYAYAVFFCHKTRDTAAYVVPLVGKDGRKAAAVAVCHQDTSKWNPGHVAFRVLKVKPGSVPVCHFLPQDHIVWVPSN